MHLLCKNNVKNLDNIIKEIYTIPVMQSYVWAKFDVDDMYTSMDRNDILTFLRGIICHDEFRKSCAIDSGLLMEMIYFSLETANYVKYGNNVYAQTKGLPQGAGDSGLYATLYLDYLLQMYDEFLFKQNRIIYWYKYMDDFLVYIPKANIETFKTNFEAVTRLTLSVETETINEQEEYAEISFLDINIRRLKHKMEICAYKKPCASQRMINFISNASETIKDNTVNQMILKILRRTCNKMIIHDLENLEAKLCNNYYPTAYIKRRFTNNIGRYMSNLNRGISNIPLNEEEKQMRINLLCDFIGRFNPNILKSTEKGKKKTHKKIAVYNTHCIPFEKAIRKVHKIYKLPECTFSMKRNIYKRVNGTIPQHLHNMNQTKDEIHNNKNDNLGLAKCSDCNTFYILSGKANLNVILEKELENAKSHIRLHMNTYKHKQPKGVYDINQEKMNDTTTQIQIYTALVSTIGSSHHNVEAIIKIPLYIKEMIKRYKEKPTIRTGLPRMMTDECHILEDKTNQNNHLLENNNQGMKDMAKQLIENTPDQTTEDLPMVLTENTPQQNKTTEDLPMVLTENTPQQNKNNANSVEEMNIPDQIMNDVPMLLSEDITPQDKDNSNINEGNNIQNDTNMLDDNFDLSEFLNNWP